MISIIICSRTPDISPELRRNILYTVGHDCELVIIDNSENRYSIFSAYNVGVRKSKGDILCFMHDDVEFVTMDWGKRIISHFNDVSIGIIGFAGSHMLSKSPMYWVEMPFYSEYNQINGILSDNWMFPSKNIVDIVACDGFCFFVRKTLFDRIKFDEETYSGFHMYDMDICMQALQNGYRVCACRDIIVNHNFGGAGNADSFYRSQLLFYDKWMNYLPITRELDDVPDFVLKKVNTLNVYAFDSAKVRRSRPYCLGKFILSPLYFLKRIIKR